MCDSQVLLCPPTECLSPFVCELERGVLAVPKRSNIALLRDPEMPFLGIFPQRIKNVLTYVHMRVQGSIVHTSQAPTNGRMNKQNVVHPHNGTVFGLKRKQSTDT